VITRMGGLPQWARALSRRWTPAASATKTGSARLIKSPLSTTPMIRLMRSSSRAGSLIRPKSQIKNAVAIVGDEGIAGQHTGASLAPSTSSDSRVASNPEATTSPAVRRPMKPCHCSGLRSWGSSASKPITPGYKLLETAVYDEYARWCERGRSRGPPLLDSLLGG
jgi:hypothetical protein